MRYKIEGGFKLKQHCPESEVCYSVALGCGEVFLVNDEDFYQITDLGDFYLVQEGGEGQRYSGASKDLSFSTGTYSSIEEIMSLLGSDWTQPRYRDKTRLEEVTRFLNSWPQDEPSVSLDEFSSNYSQNCILVKHVDGNTYLYDVIRELW